MSWARLDDAISDHPKVFDAGASLGANGPAIVIGFFAVAILWSNKHLTDGFIPTDIVTTFRHVAKPLAVADALTRAGLLERTKRGTPPRPGFVIHDFGDYNFSAAQVKQKRRADRDRKRGNGHG